MITCVLSRKILVIVTSLACSLLLFTLKLFPNDANRFFAAFFFCIQIVWIIKLCIL